MPRIEQDTSDTMLDRRYFWAKVKKLYSEDDTADIVVVDSDEVEIDDLTFNKCPIFFHCDEDVEKRSNGALTGGAGGFKVDDICYCYSENQGLPVVVVNKILRACDDGFLFIVDDNDPSKQFFTYTVRNGMFAKQESDYFPAYGNAADFLLVTGSAVPWTVFRDPVLIGTSWQSRASLVSGYHKNSADLIWVGASTNAGVPDIRTLPDGPFIDEVDTQYNIHNVRWVNRDFQYGDWYYAPRPHHSMIMAFDKHKRDVQIRVKTSGYLSIYANGIMFGMLKSIDKVTVGDVTCIDIKFGILESVMPEGGTYAGSSFKYRFNPKEMDFTYYVEEDISPHLGWTGIDTAAQTIFELDAGKFFERSTSPWAEQLGYYPRPVEPFDNCSWLFGDCNRGYTLSSKQPLVGCLSIFDPYREEWFSGVDRYQCEMTSSYEHRPCCAHDPDGPVGGGPCQDIGCKSWYHSWIGGADIWWGIGGGGIDCGNGSWAEIPVIGSVFPNPDGTDYQYAIIDVMPLSILADNIYTVPSCHLEDRLDARVFGSAEMYYTPYTGDGHNYLQLQVSASNSCGVINTVVEGYLNSPKYYPLPLIATHRFWSNREFSPQNYSWSYDGPPAVCTVCPPTSQCDYWHHYQCSVCGDSLPNDCWNSCTYLVVEEGGIIPCNDCCDGQWCDYCTGQISLMWTFDPAQIETCLPYVGGCANEGCCEFANFQNVSGFFGVHGDSTIIYTKSGYYPFSTVTLSESTCDSLYTSLAVGKKSAICIVRQANDLKFYSKTKTNDNWGSWTDITTALIQSLKDQIYPVNLPGFTVSKQTEAIVNWKLRLFGVILAS